MKIDILFPQDLIDQLKDYRIRFPQESERVDFFFDFINHKNQHFLRENDYGHFTASAFIVNKTSSKILLTHHGKLDKWIQLGGHADGNTDLLAVALQEAREESGIQDFTIPTQKILDIDYHQIPPFKNTPAHIHFDVRYLLVTDDRIPIVISKESKDLQWIPMQKISDYTEERSMLRPIKKIKSS